MTTDDALHARVTELEARNEELQRQIKLYAPSTSRLPGNRVVLVFFSLILLSMTVASTLWFSGRKAAQERRVAATQVVPDSRLDEAGWAVVREIHKCLAETSSNDTIDLRLEVRLTPAGTLGLVDSSIKPNNERFVPCIRRIPADIKLVPQEGSSAPSLEVRYLVEHSQEGTYQARWSWRQL